MNNEISAARYREIRDIAGQVLLERCPPRFPIPPARIISSYKKCRLVRFSVFSSKMLYFDFMSTQDFFGTRDACTLYDADEDRYLVCYNDTGMMFHQSRGHWSFAHELGHIVLGHIAETSRMVNGLTITTNELYEKEADYFAAMLLAYPAVVRACSINEPQELAALARISLSAAQNRLNSMRNSAMMLSETDRLVLSKFSSFIEDWKNQQTRRPLSCVPPEPSCSH